MVDPIIEQIERLHATLSRWEDGSNFKLQRVRRAADDASTICDSGPGDARSFWIAEVYENGVDSPAETGEGPTSEAALANLLERLRARARERIAAIEAAVGGPRG